MDEIKTSRRVAPGHASAKNLTNVLASTFTNSPQWIEQQAVTRPRVAGVKFSYKF